MERTNWKMVLPLAAGIGFVLTGFWGLLLGPIAAVPVMSWRKRREGIPADDEDRRLAAFMAETLAASAPRKPAPRQAARPSFEQMRARSPEIGEAELFDEYLEERTELRLPPAQWEALGRALFGAGSFMQAAWALHAGALLAGDVLGAQKRLIEVAGKAGEAGHTEVALKLYRTLLAKYPDSAYAQFARDNMKLEEKRLITGRDKAGRD